MVNVLYTTDYYNKANTGITFAIKGLIDQVLENLRGSKIGLIASGVVDVEVTPDTLFEHVPSSTNPIARAWRYAPGYADRVAAVISDHAMSVLHVHGTWMHPQFASVQAGHKSGVPVILTNHGHLEEWALSQPGRLGALKKRLYLRFMEAPMFRKVDVFHAISPLNRDMIHKLFPGVRVELIPNSIDLNAADRLLDDYRRPSVSEPYVLFVGRLMPQKGIDLLIQAFSNADLPANWKLVLIGPEESPSYADYLKRLIADSPRRAAIVLRGPIWDQSEKMRVMADAQVMAVPSRSEVVALVNLEAAACRTPTITTRSTGLLDWMKGGGLLIEPDIAAIERALVDAAHWSAEERNARGDASRKLVENVYSTAVTGPRWAELYRSLA